MCRTAGLACARMYAVTRRARSAWRALLGWAGKQASVELNVVDYPPPSKLEALWTRTDMACVFMCGWPFWSAATHPIPIAAPIPCGIRYAENPVYFTDFIARSDRGYRNLRDTFGGRIGWTADRSHSGFNAPRYHLLSYYQQSEKSLYCTSVGQLMTPANALSSVISGQVDVAPLDSYALDLIAFHEPERIKEITVLESTVASPIPLLVASPEFDAEAAARLTNTFEGAAENPYALPLLTELNLKGFASVAASEYAITDSWSQAAIVAGYSIPT